MVLRGAVVRVLDLENLVRIPISFLSEAHLHHLAEKVEEDVLNFTFSTTFNFSLKSFGRDLLLEVKKPF